MGFIFKLITHDYQVMIIKTETLKSMGKRLKEKMKKKK